MTFFLQLKKSLKRRLPNETYREVGMIAFKFMNVINIIKLYRPTEDGALMAKYQCFMYMSWKNCRPTMPKMLAKMIKMMNETTKKFMRLRDNDNTNMLLLLLLKKNMA
jgi:hypothetical protein